MCVLQSDIGAHAQREALLLALIPILQSSPFPAPRRDLKVYPKYARRQSLQAIKPGYLRHKKARKSAGLDIFSAIFCTLKWWRRRPLIPVLQKTDVFRKTSDLKSITIL